MERDGEHAPLVWTWGERGGTRVVVLTADALVASDVLSEAEVAEIDDAVLGPDPLSPHFGERALFVDLADVYELRFALARRRVSLAMVDGVTTCHVQPSVKEPTVAAEIFDALHNQLAPDVDPVETGGASTAAPRRWVVPAMAVLAVLAVVCAVLGSGGRGDEPSGLLAQAPVWAQDVFSDLGFFPAAVLFLGVAVLNLIRPRGLSENATRHRDAGLVVAVAPPPVPAEAADVGGDVAPPVVASVEPGHDPLADIVARAVEDDPYPERAGAASPSESSVADPVTPAGDGTEPLAEPAGEAELAPDPLAAAVAAVAEGAAPFDVGVAPAAEAEPEPAFAGAGDAAPARDVAGEDAKAEAVPSAVPDSAPPSLGAPGEQQPPAVRSDEPEPTVDEAVVARRREFAAMVERNAPKPPWA